MVYHRLKDILEGKVPSVTIPEKYHAIFNPHVTCVHCGYPVVLNENMTFMQCSNSSCSIKIVKSLVKVVRNLGIKGLGPATIIKLVDYANEEFRRFESLSDESRERLKQEAEKQGTPLPSRITTRMEFLMHPVVRNREEFEDVYESKRTFAEVVKLLHIPDVGIRSEKIFAGCNSYEDFQAKVLAEGGMKKYLRKALELSDNATTLIETMSLRIITYASDLKKIPQLFSILPATLKVINLVITGSILNTTGPDGRTLSKATYTVLLNSKFERMGCRLSLHSRVSQSTQILVSDAGGTSNYWAAVEINEARQQKAKPGEDPNLIIITTSNELLENLTIE